MRPIDIARQLQISPATLRGYEARGLLPPVPRSAAGFRVYTAEHLAYFVAIRELLPGFGLTDVARILGEVMAGRSAAARWLVTAAQAALQQERVMAQRLARHLLPGQGQRRRPGRQPLTVAEVSRETGIPATTLRYWDKIGLIVAERQDNNYRTFDESQFRRILAIGILRLAIRATHQKHFLGRVRSALTDFDFTDRQRIAGMLQSIDGYLDQVNRDQIRGIAALHHLCEQVESERWRPGQ